MKYNLKRPIFWLAMIFFAPESSAARAVNLAREFYLLINFQRRGTGIFLLFFLLLLNHEASAQGYKLRYTDTAAGAVTFTGNTLGLNYAAGAGSVGAFITTNLTLNAGGGFPNGTTLNWSNNSSSAMLQMPTNSTVLYAELIWAGTCETVSNAPANSASNVLSYVTNTAVHFFLPDGSSNSVVPDPTTLTIVTNFNGTTQQALFYVRSADVTALVKAAGAGTYTVGGVPAEISALDASDDCAGWTLAVAYANSSLHQRNLSIFVGNYWINAASAASSPPVGIAGFCAPPTGAVNGYLFVSAMEGDSQTAGDQMEFGVTTNSFTALSGPNNPVNNFFCSQINYCQPDNLLGTTITNGYLDTSGTFGLSNSIPGSSKIYARQGWDITCVNASAALTNSATSAFAKFITSGDGYSASALALQIDVGSPVLTTSQTVDKGSTFVGDTLTYTVVVTNSGTADAVNLIFTDPLPFGTSYIANSFKTNGVVIAGANPVNGVGVPIIKQNGSYTATYQVQVNQIPPDARFITHATINFQYAGACAQSPIINSTLVNADVQTLVPLLNVNKTSSQTNLVPGSTFTYTINIPNVGTTNTTDSALNDQIPAGTTYVPGTTTNNGVHIPDIGPGGTNMPYTVTTEIHGPGRPAGEIDVGDTVVVTFQVKISPTFPSYINNTATIYVNTNAPSSSQSAAANIPPFFCDLAAGIVGTPNPVAAGGSISYTVTVTNLGVNSVNDYTNFITLSLPLSQSISSLIYTPSIGTYNPLNGVWSGVNLPSNGVVTLNISGTVSPNDTASNIISSVTVIPPSGLLDIVTNNNTAAATNTIAQVADLAVTISDGVTNVHQGDSLTYTVTAVNLGPSTLTSLTVSNSLSTNDLVFIPSLFANFTFSPNQGSYNPANGVWSGLDLAPGDSATLTLQATVLNNVSGFFTNTVIVSVPSGVTDPVLTNNTSSDVDIILTAPDVAIFKTGPTNVFAGTNFSYAITLTNSGFATASNVVASDVLPTNVVFVSASGNGTNNSGVVNWKLGSLAVNATSNLTLTVTAPASGNITNVATSTASTPDSNPGNNTSPPVGTTVTPVADLAAGKSAPASVIATSNFTYTVSVTNLGPSDASGVIATDTLPANVAFVSASGGGVHAAGGVSWTLGTLNAGQVSNVTLIVTAPASGSITNTAKVSSTTLDTNAVNNASPSVITAVTPLALSADVSVTKAGPAVVFAGTNFSYTITVTNAGVGTASNVVASDVLPTNVVFFSAGGSGTNNAGTVTWSLGNLILHATTNLTLMVTAPASGTITNSATVASTTADPNPGNNTSPPVGTTVTAEADLAVGKSGLGTVFAGSNLTYTVTVTNLGPSPASGVVVTDALPVGVTFLNASGLGATNLSGQVIWTAGTLSAGAVSNLTLNVSAPASGTITNFASVGWPGGDPNLTNNTSPPVTTVVTPVADIVVTNVGPTNVLAGSVYTNTISVTNLGPSVASNVVVVDTEPGGVLVTNTFASLPVGGGTNFTVVETAPGNGPLTNSASSTAATGDPDLGNNTNIVAVTAVTAEADLAVGKSGLGTVFAGSNLTYTVTVTNLGPSPASGVVVTDALPVGVTFLNASGLGATNLSGQVIWTAGTLSAGAVSNLTLNVSAPASGTITNFASVGWPGGDPNLTNNTSPPVTTVVTPVADIVVTNVGPTNVLAGSVYTNTISVTNLGPSVASNVVVVDTEPGGVLVTNTFASLPVGGGTNFTVVETAPGNGPLTNSASSTAATGDPDLGNNTNIVAVTAVTAEADLAVGKSGLGTVFAGSNLTYTVTVTNLGPSPASGVVVTDALPVGVTFLNASGLGATNLSGQVIWTAGTLSAGAVSNLTLNVSAPASGTITNFASVGWPGGDPNLTNNTSPPVTTVVTPVADIVVTNVGPTNVLAGSVYTNTISVTNLGPSVASNVVVVDTEPGGVLVTNTFASLPVGGGTNFTVVETAPGNGPLTNSASSTAATGDPDLGNNTNIVAVTAVTAEADLAVGKSGLGTVFAGSNLTYTVTVTNLGPSPASGVVVTDALPVGVTFLNASGLGATNLSGQVIWTAGTLSAGAVSNLTLNVSAPASGTITNFASVGWPGGDPNLTNNTSPPVTTVVTPVADIVVTNVGPTNVLAGSVYTNTISVTNLGPSVASNVVVVDTEPGGVLVTNTFASLPVGGGTNFTVVETAPGNGPLTNSASSTAATGDPDLGNNTNIVAVTAVTAEADLAVGKSGLGTVFAGSNLTYTVTVTNLGPSPASGVVVTDALPVGVTFLNASGLGATNLSGQVIWTAGTLSAGAVSNLTLNVSAPASGTITNFASVGWPGGDPNLTNNTSPPVTTVVVVGSNIPPVAVNDNYIVVENTPLTVPAGGVLTNDTDAGGNPLTAILATGPSHGTLTLSTNGGFTYTPATNFTGVDNFTYRANDGVTNSGLATVTLTVLPAADVVVLKTGPASGVAGSNLVYTITVTNHGPATATNVLVSDQLPAGLTFVSATPATVTVSTNNLATWPAFNQAKNAKSIFTVTLISPEGGNFTNVAFGTTTTFDPNPTNNDGTATNSQVVTTVTPRADLAVFKTGSANIAANGAVNYTITVTNIGPSTATNVVVTDTLPLTVAFQGASGSYNLSGNVLTWPVTTLTKGATTNFTVSVMAPANGSFTNIAFGTSDTPDPNPTNNNGTLPGSKVTTTVVPSADVSITVTGPPTVTVGDGFSYTLVVSNAGPSIAVNTLVTNVLPTNLVFASASGGGTNKNGVVTWPVFPTLTNGQSTNLILTVTPTAGVSTIVSNSLDSFNFIESNTTPTIGFLTNSASAFAATFDPNLTNNSASTAYTNAEVQTVIVPGVFSIFLATNTYATNLPSYTLTNTITPIGNNLFIIGTSAFNPQTGLYEEDVTVTNVGTVAVHALRLYIGNLRSGVTLYNATGTNNGMPYVEYDPPYNSPLNPFPAVDSSVTFVLEFFVANRLPFTNSLTAVAINPPVTAPINGTIINITTNFVDYRFTNSIPGDLRYVIVFDSIPGRTYTIEYSPDMATWSIAVPSIVASANATQWYDDGPPETVSKPFTPATPTRYYRVLLDP